MPGSCLVALLCTLSTASICFLLYGDHIHEAYSKWDLTKVLYRGTKFTPFSDTNDLHCERDATLRGVPVRSGFCRNPRNCIAVRMRVCDHHITTGGRSLPGVPLNL